MTCVSITQDSNSTASSTKANRLFKANRLMLNTMNTYASISGPTGGNDLFSKFIITTVAFPYSFSASGGSAGVSISPSTATASVQSSVYFTN